MKFSCDYIWQLIFVVLLLVLVVWKQPYQTKFLNCLDSLILFNVILIFYLYLYVQNLAEVHSTSEYPWVFFALGVILIWLVYFVLYLCWLILHKSVLSCSVYIGSGRLSTACFRKFSGEPALEEEQPLLNSADLTCILHSAMMLTPIFSLELKKI